jgi:hypothetical protein
MRENLVITLPDGVQEVRVLLGVVLAVARVDLDGAVGPQMHLRALAVVLVLHLQHRLQQGRDKKKKRRNR